MTLYRASRSRLELAIVVKAPHCELPEYADQYVRGAEELLEQRRPGRHASRLSSWCVCEDPAYAATYLDAERPQPQGRTEEKHLFSITMSQSSRHPMYLVNKVAQKLTKGELKEAEVLADEYWTPTQDWQFWEHLGEEIVAQAEETWPTPMKLAVAQMAYQGEELRLNAFLMRQRRGC